MPLKKAIQLVDHEWFGKHFKYLHLGYGGMGRSAYVYVWYTHYPKIKEKLEYEFTHFDVYDAPFNDQPRTSGRD